MQNKIDMKKGLRFQRTATDNIFALFSIAQNSGEELIKHNLDQLSWIPETSRKSVLDISKGCQQATTTLKSMVDQGYDIIEKQLSATPATFAKKTQPVKAKAAPKPAAKTAAKPAPVKKAPAAKKTTTTAKPKAVKKAATPKAPAKPAAVKTSSPKVATSATPAAKPAAQTPAKPSVAKVAAKPTTPTTNK